jgi:hypothetical protein
VRTREWILEMKKATTKAPLLKMKNSPKKNLLQ